MRTAGCFILLVTLSISALVWAKEHSVTLQWQRVEGVTYNVYRCKKDGTHCRKIASNVAAGTYKDTHVRAGDQYRYKVTAVQGTHESAPVTVDAAIPTK